MSQDEAWGHVWGVFFMCASIASEGAGGTVVFGLLALAMAGYVESLKHA